MSAWRRWAKRWLGRSTIRRPIKQRRPLVVEGLEERLVLFAFCGGTWPQPGGLGMPVNVTYSYRNLFDGGVVGVNNFTMLQAIEEGLSLWARYAPFTFREVTSGSITFGHQPLDGGTVGVASCPLGGDISFDDSSRTFSVNLFLYVSVHELGHALGLDHSTVVSLPVDRVGPASVPILNPSVQNVYSGLGSAFLYQDDVDGIRARYGTGSGEVITTRTWIAGADGDWDTDASWGPTVGTTGGTNFEPTINADATIQGGWIVSITGGTRRARTVTLGNADGSTGALTVSGGSLTARGALRIGVNGSGTLTIPAGTVNAVGLAFGGNNVADQQQVIVNGGVLVLGAPVTDGTGTSTLTVSAGTLDLNGNALTVDRFLFHGGSLVNMNGLATVRNLLQVGNVTLAIPSILLQGGFTLDPAAAGAATVNSNFDLGGGTRVFSIADTSAGVDLFFNGAIENGGVTKAGPGTLRLGGANGYAGPTSVNEGELFVAGSIAGSPTTVAGGAGLRGTGTVGTLTANGFVRPGASAGTLTVNGGYTQSATGVLDIELGGLAAGSEYDVLQVNGSATLAGQLNVSLLGGFQLTPGASFDVVRANGITINGLMLTGAPAGSLTMSVVDVGGGQQVLRLTVAGGAPSLRVTAITPTATGFFAQLNRAMDTGVLNLYDAEGGGLGVADVTMVGTATGPVRGTVVLNTAGDGFTFIRTGGPLLADSYSITLRSAADGFRDTTGGLLDGDGTPGGHFVNSFTAVPPAVAVSVTDLVRGPGQSADVPLRLSNGAGVTSVTLTLRYDPALLTISAAATAVPGASVTLNTATPGQAVLTFSAPTPLGSGPLDFLTLTTAVPDAAPYSSKRVLDLTEVRVNNGTIDAADDDGVYIVAYLGDTSGNAGYSALDGTRALRIAVGLDSGFLPYQLADPVLLADVTGNGVINAADATRILQAALGIDQPSIPPLPGVIPPIVPGGPDPLLRFPKRLRARPGSLVTVPLLLSPSDGLEAVDVAVSYDVSRLEVVDVRRGRLTRDFGLFAANVDAEAGTIRVGLGRSAGAISGRGNGRVLELVFRVKADAPAGTAVINLRQGLGTTTTQLNEGGLDLNPDPSNEEGDALDGSVAVRGRPAVSNRPAPPVPELVDAVFALAKRRKG